MSVLILVAKHFHSFLSKVRCACAEAAHRLVSVHQQLDLWVQPLDVCGGRVSDELAKGLSLRENLVVQCHLLLSL